MEKNASLQELSFAWLSLIKDQAKLFALESELAHISMFPLLMSGLALALFLISLWIMILVILAYVIYDYQNNVLISLCSVFLFNLFVIGLAYLSLRRYRMRMRFQHTRAAIREILR